MLNELKKYKLGTMLEIKNFLKVNKNTSKKIPNLNNKDKIIALFDWLKEEIKANIENDKLNKAIKLSPKFPLSSTESIMEPNHLYHDVFLNFKKWAEEENLEIGFALISDFYSSPEYPILVYKTKKSYLNNISLEEISSIDLTNKVSEVIL